MQSVRFAALILLLLTPARAFAQTPSRGAFVEGGFQVFRQPGPSGTTAAQTYVTAPGGSTAGWSAGGGVTVGGHTSLFVEWATTGWMKAIEPSRYSITYHEARRDRFFTVAARYALDIGPRVALEPMAGIVFTTEEATSEAEYTDPIVPRPSGPLVTHKLNTGIGPVVGADVRLGTSRLSFVPSFRMIRNGITKGRYDDTAGSPEVEVESIYPGGYPSWTTRVGAQVRLRF